MVAHVAPLPVVVERVSVVVAALHAAAGAAAAGAAPAHVFHSHLLLPAQSLQLLLLPQQLLPLHLLPLPLKLHQLLLLSLQLFPLPPELLPLPMKTLFLSLTATSFLVSSPLGFLLFLHAPAFSLSSSSVFFLPLSLFLSLLLDLLEGQDSGLGGLVNSLRAHISLADWMLGPEISSLIGSSAVSVPITS